MYIDKNSCRDEFMIPHFSEEHSAGQQLIRPPHHIFQHAVLLRLELDFATSPVDGSPDSIKLEWSYSQGGLLRTPNSASILANSSAANGLMR